MPLDASFKKKKKRFYYCSAKTASHCIHKMPQVPTMAYTSLHDLGTLYPSEFTLDNLSLILKRAYLISHFLFSLLEMIPRYPHINPSFLIYLCYFPRNNLNPQSELASSTHTFLGLLPPTTFVSIRVSTFAYYLSPFTKNSPIILSLFALGQ